MASRTPHEGLGLGLGTSGLGFGLGLERKFLALRQGQDFLPPQDSGHVVAVPVCSVDTHSVTLQSAIYCLGMLQRLACELDLGCKIIRVCEVRAAV